MPQEEIVAVQLEAKSGVQKHPNWLETISWPGGFDDYETTDSWACMPGPSGSPASRHATQAQVGCIERNRVRLRTVRA